MILINVNKMQKKIFLLFNNKISNDYYNNNNLMLSDKERIINNIKHIPPANKE